MNVILYVNYNVVFKIIRDFLLNNSHTYITYNKFFRNSTFVPHDQQENLNSNITVLCLYIWKIIRNFWLNAVRRLYIMWYRANFNMASSECVFVKEYM